MDSGILSCIIEGIDGMKLGSNNGH
jgi:hypothetical protein